MNEHEFLMALAFAHKNWKGRDCAIQFRPAGAKGWEARCVAEQSARYAYDTPLVVLLQNSRTEDSDLIVCTYAPTEMCKGMAWTKEVQQLVHPSGNALSAINPHKGANSGYPVVRVNPKAWPVAIENAKPDQKTKLEIKPNWTADAWAKDWYEALDANQASLTAPSRSTLQSYVGATENKARAPTDRAATPPVFDTGLPITPPTPSRHATLIDKLFMAIAQALVAVTLNEKDDKAKTGVPAGHNIGGLLVDKTNKIIGWGVNAVKLNATFHAETAMIQAYLRRQNASHLPEGCRIYTTLEPCHMCAGFIATVGRKTKVFYGQKDNQITSVLDKPNTHECTQVRSEIVYPYAPPVGVGDDTWQVADMLKEMQDGFSRGGPKGVVAFLYSKAAKDFFTDLRARPQDFDRILGALVAETPKPPTGRPGPQPFPRLDLARVMPKGGSPQPPRPSGASTIGGLDLAVARKPPQGPRAGPPQAPFEPGLKGLVEVLGAGQAIVAAAERARKTL